MTEFSTLLNILKTVRLIYDGKEVIRGDDLSEIDTSNIALVLGIKGTKLLAVQRYRDILKKAILMQSDKAYYLFLGIENQSEIHYAMPVRNMLYNALVYNQQVETIAKYNKEKGNVETEKEFLSGFTNIKLPRKNKEGKHNMCKGIMEIQEEYKKIGEEEGIRRMLEVGRTQDQIADFCGYDIKQILEVQDSIIKV